MRAIRLEARGGIRIQGVTAIEPKTVERTRTRGRDPARKIARCFRSQLDPLGIAGAPSPSSFDDDLYSPAARRPYAEMYAAFLQRFRSNGELPLLLLLAHRFLSFHRSADRS